MRVKGDSGLLHDSFLVVDVDVHRFIDRKKTNFVARVKNRVYHSRAMKGRYQDKPAPFPVPTIRPEHFEILIDSGAAAERKPNTI